MQKNNILHGDQKLPKQVHEGRSFQLVLSEELMFEEIYIKNINGITNKHKNTTTKNHKIVYVDEGMKRPKQELQCARVIENSAN